MLISNAMIESNDGGKPYMKEKNESKEKNKTRNEDKNEGKIIRVLEIYTRLLNGAVINKEEEAERYGVAKRSIQRDIDSIREYLRRTDNKSGVYDLVNYDYRKKGYCLEHIYKVKLKSSEILAICKILLESRSMTKREMTDILDKLIECCVPLENQRVIKDLILNEEFHYIEPQHKTVFIDKMWNIGQAIREHQYIEIEYKKMKGKETVTRKLKPGAIMFSEYYFYLTAFIDDKKVREDFNILEDSFPTIYRMDRIHSLKISKEKFNIPYKDRFEEGEFRKRIQFMYGGPLQKVRFKYSGISVEAVLDRLPTARILHEDESGYTIEAEVFGEGIKMWIRSQGELISEVSYR